MNIFFAISSKNINFTRFLGKIDEILSYVGGLFGIVGIVLSFFISKYNEYKY